MFVLLKQALHHLVTEISLYLQVNLRVLCSITYRTYIHYMVVIGSILFYYVFLALYSILRPGALNGVGKSDNAYWVIFQVSKNACTQQTLS